MKKILFILLIALSLSAADKKDELVPVRLGAGPLIATDGFGGSFRFWIKDALGFSLQMNKKWDMEMGGGELQFHYKFNTPTLLKPYLLAGGGFQLIDLDDITPAVENEPIGTFTAGAGAEALLGEAKQHGLSLEAAFNMGKLEYRGTAETEIGEGGQSSEVKDKSVDPFSVTALYHFYFIPRRARDDDGDGMIETDKCPEAAEDRDGFNDDDGCPDYDNDADGIPDTLDNCIDDPEDKDGFEDEDGCVDLDNDKDSIPDSRDKCPNSPEDPDGFIDDDGCPEKDNDRDGFADKEDMCPDQAEVINGVMDSDGCPDKVPEEFIRVDEAAIPTNNIQFQAYSTIPTNASWVTLGMYVDFLKKWPGVKVEIQGHTDNSGNMRENKRLSQIRAETVRDYLIKHGINSGRLSVKAYHQSKPIESNETAEGRSLNRRVQIVIIK